MRTISIFVVALQLAGCSLIVDAKLDDKSDSNSTNTTNITNSVNVENSTNTTNITNSVNVENSTNTTEPGVCDVPHPLLSVGPEAQEFDPSKDQAFDLAVDSNGKPHIVVVNEMGELTYRTWEDEDAPVEQLWRTEVPGPRQFSKVAITVAPDTVHVVAREKGSAKVWHLVRVQGNGWQEFAADFGDSMPDSSWDSFDVGVAPDGKLSVAAIVGGLLRYGRVTLSAGGVFEYDACETAATDELVGLSKVRLSSQGSWWTSSVYQPSKQHWRLEKYLLDSYGCPKGDPDNGPKETLVGDILKDAGVAFDVHHNGSVSVAYVKNEELTAFKWGKTTTTTYKTVAPGVDPRSPSLSIYRPIEPEEPEEPLLVYSSDELLKLARFSSMGWISNALTIHGGVSGYTRLETSDNPPRAHILYSNADPALGGAFYRCRNLEIDPPEVPGAQP